MCVCGAFFDRARSRAHLSVRACCCCVLLILTRARAVEWYRQHPGYWENAEAALGPHPPRLSGGQWFPR
jgi:hypothetical protein